MVLDDFMAQLGLNGELPGAFSTKWHDCERAPRLDCISPIDSSLIGKINCCNETNYNLVVESAKDTFKRWRLTPAPQRGEVVRQIACALRDHKEPLGRLITLEVGKILSEGLGEVQEAIDVADFAVGLSRQLYGLSMHSERPSHRMYEQWHPVGPVGVITAFNFPIAVWAWNAMIAAVCGNTVVWKPSEHAPLSAIATHKICSQIASQNGFPGLFGLVIGDGPKLGERMAQDVRLPIISATGSTKMGRSVGQVVANRFGKSILELGGNNAVIVLDDANINLALASVCFGAIGTAGQRCTSTRRLLITKGVVEQFTDRLLNAYAQVKIGNPMQEGVLMGPLINENAAQAYDRAIKDIVEQGGTILRGGKRCAGLQSNLYVEPTVVMANKNMPIVAEETFAPILYIIPVSDLSEAVDANNSVPQGLSSAIFTQDLSQAERFLSCEGSDCGIANVNIGTSGAEIGGAFGGEKETGGGRESGSDAWRQYMRRQTNTINFSSKLPLAQGVKFDVGIVK